MKVHCKLLTIRFRILILLIGIVFSHLPFHAYCQSVIKGTVSDKVANPVPFANVFLKVNGIAVHVAATDESGRYEINNIDTGRYEFNVSALGYLRQTSTVNIDEKKVMLHVDVQLATDTMMLEEVVVTAESAIKSKGDTLIYSANQFATGEEAVLEDLLKKLPGIDILDNGRVQFQGKEVTRIKVESDDLFGGNYSLLTKNLSADLVESVEVLQEYTDNPLLKGIDTSDDVALNLTLKENRKANIFGEIKAGSDFRQRHELKLNLASFLKKVKVYALSNFNTIGEDPTGDAEEIMNSNLTQGRIVGDGVYTHEIVSTNRPSIREFKRDRYLFNQSKFGALSTIYKPTRNLSLALSGYLYADRLPFEQITESQFYTANDTISYNESTRSRNEDMIAFLRATLEYQLNDKARLFYNGFLNYGSRSEYQRFVFNTNDVSKFLVSDASVQSHHINFTDKVSPISALTLDFRYIRDSRPQSLSVAGNVLDVFTDQEPLGTVDQRTNFVTEFSAVEGNYLSNKNKNRAGLKVGLKTMRQQFLSDLFSGESDLSANMFILRQKNLYIGPYYTISVGSLSATSSVVAEHIDNDMSDRGRNSFLFINPKVSLKWKPSNEHSLSGILSMNNSVSRGEQMYRNPLLTNYNFVAVGDSSIRTFSNKTAILSYVHGGWGKGLTMHSTFFYQDSPDAYLSNIIIRPNYTFVESNRVADRRVMSLSLSADKYFKSLSSNVKLSVSSSRSRFMTMLDQVPTETESRTNQVDLSLRSAFTGSFNFHVGHVLFHTSNANQFIDDDNYYLQYYADLYVKLLANKLNLNFHLERFDMVSLMDRPTYSFFDVNIKYQLDKSRFTFYAKARNLANEKEYIQRSISSQGTTVLANRIVDRYVMLGLSIRI
jgi:hypothetical protein